MRVKSFFIVVLLFCALFESSANSSVSGYSVPSVEVNYGAMSVAELWNMGNSAYANNDYLGAEKAYLEVLNRELHSAELYYNLGNLYHRQGSVGQSLLYLYRAQRLEPSDRDIAHNIEVVKMSTVDDIEELPTLFVKRWAEWISTRFSIFGWTLFSLVSLALALGFVLLYIFSDGLSLRRVGFAFTAIFALLFALSTSLALDARREVLSSNEAVVMRKRAAVMSAPDSSSTEIFNLHEGTKITIEREYGDWCEVRIGDGKQGWIELSNIAKI